jgi:hypothetical protein
MTRTKSMSMSMSMSKTFAHQRLDRAGSRRGETNMNIDRRGASRLAGLALVLAVVAPTSAWAQAPATMPLQGYLTDDSGEPIDASLTVGFGLYDRATGGSSLYTESQDVTFDRGFFTAHLGEEGDLDLALFRGHGTLFLAVTIGGE